MWCGVSFADWTIPEHLQDAISTLTAEQRAFLESGEVLMFLTERQLEIVSLLLQTDPDKQLTLSGHTDAIGSETCC